jgi:serine protease Do
MECHKWQCAALSAPLFMRRFLVFVLVVALCVYGLYQWTLRRGPIRLQEQFTPAAGPRVSDDDVHVLETMDREYTRLVQAVVPSVVSITATRRVQAPATIDPFQFFFGHGFSPQRTEEMRSLGSGVIVSREGHILTNQHVVANVDEVRIRFANGQEAAAQLIGEDPATDIAVLKVTGLNVTPLAFGDSDQVQVGQRVIAVGNPFGFDETVTQGIICAKGRAMENSANDFFQTDAAINPGNSGGPLINVRGEIIGINSLVYGGSGSESRQGLGFAIPANTARRVLEDIIKTGRVPHGYLGIMTPDPELAARMGLPQIDGAYVISVTPGSPADKAGIKQGDIITALGSHPIHNFNELRTQASALEAGSSVPITLQRAGQPITVTADIVEQPRLENAPAPAPAQGAVSPATPQTGLLSGVHVTEIPADQIPILPPNAHGVMVTDIDAGTPAARTLQQDDVIEEIDHLAIHSVAEFEQAASAVRGPRVLLGICRDQRRSYTVVDGQ